MTVETQKDDAVGTNPKTDGDVADAKPEEGGEAKQEASLLGGAKDDAKEGDQGQASGESDKGAASDAEIEVKLPEGVEVDQVLMDGFKTVAKDAGLNSESASKVVAWYAKHQDETAKAQMAEYEKQSADWVAELKSDVDFGGKNFDESVAAAKSAVARFGGDTLAAELERLGIGNLPILVKAFSRIGKAFSEDTTSAQAAKNASTAANSREERLARRYNNSQQPAG